ncbi:MAG: UDP-N-acetylglucosamine 4,6-dehydratase (inverting) [Deltaproteobacteria bacterium]|nr:UDP-N-acetylglucosamine 4,6-dehydratase (inverting) [Deltaproteobacteria bacterium]
MLNNSSILVTGGTGSFGKTFTSWALENYDPARIIIFSRDEFKQDLMFKTFLKKYGEEKTKKLRFFIGDVRDKDRLYRAFKGVDYVVHAAALKQVPACEYNPFEAIKTNIHGAQNVIDAALDRGVKKVVALSTDKAVNPINLYGGTKLVSDKLFISANAYTGKSGTLFCVVRYGNVSGSRGSVIPFFMQLLKQGRTSLPITHAQMTRFWMTLDDAVILVVKALTESKGGEVYVHKNPSYRVIDIAKALNPDGTIEDIGIREGEKIHECMITSEDSVRTYEYGNFYIIYPNFSWWKNELHFTQGGKPIQEGWEYNSGTNTVWLDADELRTRINKLDIEI